MIGITILGSTGSIGVNTLDVIQRHSDRFQVTALTAHTQTEKLFEQCQQFQPRYAVVDNPIKAESLQQRLRQIACMTEVLSGTDALAYVAALPEAQYVMAAIVGAAGLLPTLAAARTGKRILLANKEALVMTGELFTREAQQNGATVLPIDSEHNAIFQCLPDGKITDCVKRILLTASGGPFRNLPLDQFTHITPEQACTHPNWRMGRKISTDSATMMNKGFEFIEAHYLFGLPVAQIDVLLHPESVVHSLVEYCDGSVLAQLGSPDMRTPIAYALGYPDRIAAGVSFLDLLNVKSLHFAPLCHERYPCFQLAKDALVTGGTAPAILNAANEVAVQYFLNGQIQFAQICQLIENVLEKVTVQAADHLDTILQADQIARRVALELIRVTA